MLTDTQTKKMFDRKIKINEILFETWSKEGGQRKITSKSRIFHRGDIES